MPKNPLYSGYGQLKRASGKPGVEASEKGRSAFRKDYSRLLHASTFRRLQGKTQLYPSSESDFFRNRLTHSLEVAQIARGIAEQLNTTQIRRVFPKGHIDESLVEFASIAHDLGHPPFGHNGEVALDVLMLNHGGFEGNAQTLHILASVERKLVQVGQSFLNTFGLDLTYRSLASVLKYDNLIPESRPEGSKVTKGYYGTEEYLVREIKRKVAKDLPGEDAFKTIECSIMDIADDIAYSTYDLEDSLHANFVTPMSLADALANNDGIRSEVRKKVDAALEKCGYQLVQNDAELYQVLIDVFTIEMPPEVAGGRNSFVVNLEAWQANQRYSQGLARNQLTARRVGKLISAVKFVPNRDFPQLSGAILQRDELLHVEVLKHLNYEVVIRSPRLAVVEYRGRDIVNNLFEAYVDSEGALLPDDWRHRYQSASGRTEKMRTICDYVAGMTDRYAIEVHGRLFGQGASIFKPL